MPLTNWNPEQIIYNVGEEVKEVSLLIKGHVQMVIGSHSITLRAGDLIGVDDLPGSTRSFYYKAGEGATTYSYPYNGIDDVVSIIQENEKLSSTITSRLISHSRGLLKLCRTLHRASIDDYDKFTRDLKVYPELCAKAGKPPMDISALHAVEPPHFSKEVAGWKIDFHESLNNNDSAIFSLLTIGADACYGIAVGAVDYISELSLDIAKMHAALEGFYHATNTFNMEIRVLQSSADAIASGDSEMAMPPMENILSQILLYAELPDSINTQFTQAVESYVSQPERSESTDTLRAIRRKLAEHYYTVYEACLKKTLTDTNVPAYIRMFLMYGFVDERIVDKKDIETLYGHMIAYRPEPGSRIITAYDWLCKVYQMEVEPSLNEFQLEYAAYLREAKQNGEISEEMAESMLNDPDARLSYEVKNLLTLGNRMTFGRISMFTPIFDSQVRMLPPERSFLSAEKLTDELNRVRSIDFTCFYREKMFSMPASKATGDSPIQLFVHEEQTPYLILFPVVGSRMILWQNIEGRKRNTPARMLLPIFFEDDLADSFTGLCGEYRWEICKTDQGVHWNDITDPSLTAEYNDFLQFFKKNGNLSADHKEKLRTLIKKHSNNYKKVFVSDYMLYMKYESQGNMRLLKQCREMLFKYCPFGGEARTRLSSSPQYEKLIEIRANKAEQKARPLQNIIAKLEKAGEEPPAELVNEIDYILS